MAAMSDPSEAGDDDALRAQAVQSLRHKRMFRVHVMTYLMVNALLIGIWVAIGVGADAWFPWPIFPILGWGVALFFHKQAVYGSRITEADIQREMRDLRGDRP